MSFLLAVSAELARIRSPQELICTAMARLRERLGAVRVTLAELDEAQDEAIVLGESGDDPSRIEAVRLPLATPSSIRKSGPASLTALACR